MAEISDITVIVTEESQNKPKHVGDINSFFAESKNLSEIVKDPTDLVVEKFTSRIINEDTNKKELLQYKFPKGLKLPEKKEKVNGKHKSIIIMYYPLKGNMSFIIIIIACIEYFSALSISAMCRRQGRRV